MSSRRWAWTVAFFGVSSLALASEPALRLSGVPNRLVFPLPEGNNVVLTATVTGGRAKSVWLAKTKDAKLKCSLTPAGRGEYQVNLADREASAVLTIGGGPEQFQVFAELEGGKILSSLPVRYSVRREPPKPPRPPKRLDFPGSVVSVTVFQRRSKEVPGSGGALFIELGDITRGQVHVTVRTAESKALIDTVSLRQGESVALDLGAEQYTVYLRQLVNVLIGDDWAVLDISRVPAEEFNQIERLLARIEASQVTFLREGKAYTGKEATAHLRQKLALAGANVKTLSQFIDQVASRSSTTGRRYEIKLSDGSIVPAKQWLEREALRRDEPKVEPKEKQETGRDR